MSRELADALRERLLDAFPPERAYAPDDFERAPMPRPVAHFLAQTLRHAAGREVEIHRSDWFDHDHPDVQQAEEQLRTALASHTRIPARAWEETLREAARQVTDYLVRPVRTAVRFAFEDGGDSLSVDQVVRRLRYFRPYSYLREAVKAYVDQKQMETLDRRQLSALLTRVDQQMAADHDADDWLRLLTPLFATGRTAFPERDGVPEKLLRSFFEAKEAASIAQRLHAARENGQDWLDEERLRRLLEEPRRVPPEPPEPPEEPPQREAAPQTQASTQTQPSAPVTEPPEEEEEAVPLWKRFQQGKSHASTSTPARQQKESAPARPLWKQFRPEPPSPEANGNTSAQGRSGPASVGDLERAVLGERAAQHRTRFIRHLFGNDDEDYARVLRRLQSAGSWGEASQIIARDVFRRHQVNIYSDAAVAFTNAVEARFRRG